MGVKEFARFAECEDLLGIIECEAITKLHNLGGVTNEEGIAFVNSSEKSVIR